jgi:hypothetical protein
MSAKLATKPFHGPAAYVFTATATPVRSHSNVHMLDAERPSASGATPNDTSAAVMPLRLERTDQDITCVDDLRHDMQHFGTRNDLEAFGRSLIVVDQATRAPHTDLKRLTIPLFTTVMQVIPWL